MRIVCLINQYPMVSHTFIRREIHALEYGVEVLRVAGTANWWTSRTCLSKSARDMFSLALLLALMRMPFTRPARLWRALFLERYISRCSARSLLVDLAYLAEACLIERWLRSSETEHLQAHFGTDSAKVAMLINSLDGPPCSFTVHVPREFVAAHFISLIEKIRRCAFVVVASSHGRNQLHRYVGHRYRLKVQLVRCGLEPAFYAQPVDASPLAQRFVCVGRLSTEKAQLLLVEATQRPVSVRAGIELVLVGDGESRDEIQCLIDRYDISDRVRITGWLNTEQVRHEILASRALALPSFAEGLPVVIMEMALRRRIISTFTAGIPKVVQPSVPGWLVPAGNLDALVDAMRACLEASTDTLTRLGVAAHRLLASHDVVIEAGKLANYFTPRSNNSTRS
jgi:colanic acid/amylovoran biosynthesis glycosyltransferase